MMLLQSELADQKNLTESYRAQLLAMESELDNLRNQSQASKQALKVQRHAKVKETTLVPGKSWKINFYSQKRTKLMLEQVDAMKEQYKALQELKRKEAQGYQSDIRILQQKMKNVEQKLVSAAITKSKGAKWVALLVHHAFERLKLNRS